MATKIKVIRTEEFLEVTPLGTIDMTTSRKLLVDIARTEYSRVDHDLLIDFRDTTWSMSSLDIYTLASELCQYGDTFRRKVAILLLPGIDFDSALFLERCSHNRGFCVEAFTDFESSMRWLLLPEDVSNGKTPPTG